MKINVSVSTKTSASLRAKQVQAMFDVPPGEKAELSWKMAAPIEKKPWNLGLIVGPSGSGKTTVARHMFPERVDVPMTWGAASVLDDVREGIEVSRIAETFGRVGFNTIPAWLRPYAVLSNGEKFRAELARRLLEMEDPIVVDEFSSVVDRQVAKIAAHAVQKYVRKHDRRFVAVTCHYDVEDWLQPDWVLEPATQTFRWRSVQSRPTVDVTVSRVPYETWRLFAPFHYLTANLHKGARCFAAHVGGRPVAFAGMMRMPHAQTKNIMRCSRLVTLPDWQGLGLAFVLIDAISAAYRAIGDRVRTYPAHPSLVWSFQRSEKWAQLKKYGTFAAAPGRSGLPDVIKTRPCAVFQYRGDKMPDRDLARAFVKGDA